MTSQNKKTPLKAHWRELRLRIVLCVLAYVAAFALCAIYAAEIYNVLLKPLASVLSNSEQRRLIFTNPGEAFFTYMHLAFLSAFIISFPVISWQIYAFLAPGLYRREKKVFMSYLASAQVLFCLAVLLVYFYVMPLIWQFFVSFESVANSDMVLPIVLEARVSEYLDMVLNLIFAFGVAFQLPVILVFLVRLGLLEVEWLAAKRRHAIVLIFIIAAILTPPDVITQITLAIPLIVLYEIAVFMCRRNPQSTKQPLK